MRIESETKAHMSIGTAHGLSAQSAASCSARATFPPAQMADGSRRTIHLRCVTTPDDAHKVLLNRLGLTLPQRLRRIDEFTQM